MNASTADMLEDGFPHGTIEGFNQGCRSAGACPAGHDHGLSCFRAKILTSGNYQYQQLVRAGEEPGTIAQMLRLTPDEPEKPVKTKQEPRELAPTPIPPAAETEPVTPKRKWAVRHAWVAFDPDGAMHGPFDGHRAAIDFVGDRLQPPTTVEPQGAKQRRPWTDADTTQLRELNGLGFSDNEISKRLGRSQSLVSSYRRKLGIQSTRDRRSHERT